MVPWHTSYCCGHHGSLVNDGTFLCSCCIVYKSVAKIQDILTGDGKLLRVHSIYSYLAMQIHLNSRKKQYMSITRSFKNIKVQNNG